MEEANSYSCGRCGKVVASSTDDLKWDDSGYLGNLKGKGGCLEHTGPQRMSAVQTCKACGKKYPTFETYTDGCTPCDHYVKDSKKVTSEINQQPMMQQILQPEGPMLMQQVVESDGPILMQQ